MSTIIKIVGQITLKALTDVESTTYYYLLQSSMAPAPSTPTTNPPTGGWSTTEPEFFIYMPTQDTTIISGKDYYTRSGEEGSYTYIKVLEPSIDDIGDYYEKIYGDTRSLYVTVQTLYTDNTFEYSQPSLSSSYEAAKEAYNRAKTALDLVGDTKQYFWEQPSAYSTSIPAGIYVTHIPQSQFKASGGPTQGNIIIQDTGITIRNGAIPLTSLTSAALNFYNPSTHEANATLSSNGLILSKGGIIIGTAGSNNSVYISSDNLGSSVESLVPTPSGGTSKTDWRAVIGSKFGVDSEGNLYANEAHISGAITATSLQVNGLGDFMSFMNFENDVLKITKPGFNYSVEIRNDGVYIVDPNNQAIASYKDYITLGTKDGNNMDIRSDSINFNISNQTYAYVAQDKWFASNAEVSSSLFFSKYSLRKGNDGKFVIGRR